MSENGMDCTTPVGRIVWGSPTKPRPRKEQDGPRKGQPVMDANGQPVQEISFGVAFPKADFAAGIWPVMSAEIATGYPNGTPQRFSFKYVDGDTVDSSGKPYAEREGYAGHYVLAFTQRINDTFAPPPVYKLDPATGRYNQLGPDDIKCGDYVSVGTNFKINVATGTNTPSIYVNPRAIELVGYGTAIVGTGGVDPTQMFGGAARALPPGASPVPVQQPNAPGMPGMAPQPPAAPMAPGMTAPPQMMPGQPVAPMAPAAPVMAPPPPAPPPMAPVGPQRPVDPSHVHNNGNGTEQWFVNGAWDGQAHPIAPAAPAAPTLPPPAHDFVQNAGMPPQMPGMPGPR
jgi:hypothetical protein